mmetsp:Transcript_79222/g.171263  ORF Transcript_79222/g.171263 Transcript_79222/m.171263 type:complete len:314 (-) Transcript_79222:18-959(-)
MGNYLVLQGNIHSARKTRAGASGPERGQALHQGVDPGWGRGRGAMGRRRPRHRRRPAPVERRQQPRRVERHALERPLRLRLRLRFGLGVRARREGLVHDVGRGARLGCLALDVRHGLPQVRDLCELVELPQDVAGEPQGARGGAGGQGGGQLQVHGREGPLDALQPVGGPPRPHHLPGQAADALDLAPGGQLRHLLPEPRLLAADPARLALQVPALHPELPPPLARLPQAVLVGLAREVPRRRAPLGAPGSGSGRAGSPGADVLREGADGIAAVEHVEVSPFADGAAAVEHVEALPHRGPGGDPPLSPGARRF